MSRELGSIIQRKASRFDGKFFVNRLDSLKEQRIYGQLRSSNRCRKWYVHNWTHASQEIGVHDELNQLLPHSKQSLLAASWAHNSTLYSRNIFFYIFSIVFEYVLGLILLSPFHTHIEMCSTHHISIRLHIHIHTRIWPAISIAVNIWVNVFVYFFMWFRC